MIIVLLVLIVVAMAVCTVLIIGALDNCTDRITTAIQAHGFGFVSASGLTQAPLRSGGMDEGGG